MMALMFSDSLEHSETLNQGFIHDLEISGDQWGFLGINPGGGGYT
jgi:hypothetical protein